MLFLEESQIHSIFKEYSQPNLSMIDKSYVCNEKSDRLRN